MKSIPCIEVITCNIFTKELEFYPIEFFTPKKSVKNNKKQYYKKVWEITLSNNLETLMNGKERGFHKWHIDHKIPIIYGFKNNIPPEDIGYISNLQPLYWRDNLLKSFKLMEERK